MPDRLSLVLSAPFIGYVRAWIRLNFPGQFVRVVGGLIALLGVTAIGLALARVRERRLIRYAAIAAALICAAWYSVATATGVPEVDVVQRFHFIEYGLITFLFYRAWRPLEDPSIVILPVLAGLVVGTADEWLQWFIPNRVGELDDVFLNGVAIACGLVFSLGTDLPAAFRRTLRPGSLRRIGRFAAASSWRWPRSFTRCTSATTSTTRRSACFKSRYSKERLGAMAAEKIEEWRTNPLPLRPAACVAGRSIHERRGDARPGTERACRRGRHRRRVEGKPDPREILRACARYAVVCLTYGPPLVARAAQRARGAAAFGPRPRPRAYVSAANPYPIYTWRPARLWAVTLALAALILAASSFRVALAGSYRFLPPLRMGS